MISQVGVLISVLFFLGILCVATWGLFFPLRRLSAGRQFCTSVLLLILSWLWESNTALVMQRGRHSCVTLPLWPPFSGQPVNAPQWLVFGMSLIAMTSIPLVILSILRLANVSRTERNAALLK